MMRKYLTCFLWVILAVFSIHAWAANTDNGAETALKMRLARVNGFYAQFTQQVYDTDHSLIQEGHGELWLQRPNLFNWSMSSPDKNSFISDGKTIWMYMPDIQQVTSLWLKDAMNNPLFLLIVQNSDENWSHYHVSQKKDRFTITPDEVENNIKQFTMTVTPNGFLSQFSFVENDGQSTQYVFSHQKLGAVSPDKFQFHVPKGVTWDDQRQ